LDSKHVIYANIGPIWSLIYFECIKHGVQNDALDAKALTHDLLNEYIGFVYRSYLVNINFINEVFVNFRLAIYAVCIALEQHSLME
jgi:hypothetical protein